MGRREGGRGKGVDMLGRSIWVHWLGDWGGRRGAGWAVGGWKGIKGDTKGK